MLPVFVLAHNIRSLENVGSIFRTSDAFGINKIFITGFTGRPPQEKISKVALGAENTVPWEYKKSPALLIKRLKKEIPKLKVVGLENNVKRKIIPLQKYKPTTPILLVLGMERTGIPKSLLKLCDELVEIPMQGSKESLNLAVAFGITAYSLSTP